MSTKQNIKLRTQKKIIITGSVILISTSLICFWIWSSKNKAKNAESLLNQKSNEAFDKLIRLAKNNSPEFWAYFQENYPDFSRKLLEICQNLKTTELILCAYIYLGFNTKDIAEYTFKAVQTIKNNKYNLRKKMSITTKDDMVIWLRMIVDEL